MRIAKKHVKIDISPPFGGYIESLEDRVMGIILEINKVGIDELVNFIQEKAKTNNLKAGDILKEIIEKVKERESDEKQSSYV